jgi:transposase
MVRPRCYDIYVEKDKVKGQETGSSFVATSHNRARHISHKMWSSTSYDGQGFWLAHKRLSQGRFRWWPTSRTATTSLEAHQLHRLIVAGDPAAPDAAPLWRRVRTG